jgi:hypothetical protein
MTCLNVNERAGIDSASAEGWLMYLIRVASERLARPRLLYPGELSPHLLRDIGLVDDPSRLRRRRP